MRKINSFDIIIPTYKPGERFLRLFEMLQKQKLPYNRLILINTEHDLMSEEIRQKVTEDKRTLLKDISIDEFDHAATRSMAVRLSTADAFICMTDDAVPVDEYLTEKLISGLNTDSAAAPHTAMCYARQLATQYADEAERYVRSFNYPEESQLKSAEDIPKLGIKSYFASDVCCAYNREIFDSLGGFIDKAIFNEDMIYAAAAIKAGFAIRYEADAKVWHSHNYTAMQQLHRNFDLGLSQSQHPEVFGGLSSEGEGIKLVTAVVRHLAASGHMAEIPAFIWRTGFRYIGYRAGKRYDKLPKFLVRAMAMNKRYIEKNVESV